MLGNLLGGFIVILIGVNLMPVVADQVFCASHSDVCGISVGAENVSGAALTILNLTPLFYALGIMAAGISIAVGGLRQAGVI